MVFWRYPAQLASLCFRRDDLVWRPAYAAQLLLLAAFITPYRRSIGHLLHYLDSYPARSAGQDLPSHSGGGWGGSGDDRARADQAGGEPGAGRSGCRAPSPEPGLVLHVDPSAALFVGTGQALEI